MLYSLTAGSAGGPATSLTGDAPAAINDGAEPATAAGAGDSAQRGSSLPATHFAAPGIGNLGGPVCRHCLGIRCDAKTEVHQ